MSNRVASYCPMRAHLIAFVAALFCGYQVYMQAAPGSMVNELMSGLSIDLAGVGFLASCLSYSYLLFQMPAGQLLDRFGCKQLLPMAILSVATGSLLMAFADTLWQAALGRVLMGAGSAFAIVGSFLLASEWYAACWFPLLVGLFEMAGMAGGMGATTILPAMVDVFGWRTGMMINAVAGLVLAITVFFVVCSGKRLTAPEDAGEISNDAQYPVFRTLLLNSLYGLCMFGMVNVFAMLWGLPFLETLYPENQSEAGMGLACMYLFIALGTVCSGWLAGVLKKCRILMMVGAFSGLNCLMVILYVPMPLFLMIMMLSLFGFASGFYSLAFLQSRQIAPSRKLGQVLAVINGSMLIAGIFFQPLIGWLLDQQLASGHRLSVAYFQIALSPLILLLLLALLVAGFSKDPLPVRKHGT
ncbi:MFS transporter [Kistimonas asteriae]|uniref:MFS transporter n=1 Tax=Kistimonas asteriae TaxID=517724 RepID=UPI001BAB882C|nr:MFS transporter [Kistimonas asteriae]